MDEYHLDVKPFQQQLSWSCGPASLRTVLYYQYGIDITDRELALVLGSDENGTSDFERGLKLLGFSFKQSSFGTLNKLKEVLVQHHLPIVHLVMSDGVGHYMVMTGYDNDHVYLSNPSTGKIVKYGIPFFLGVWKIEERETQTRWFLAITGKTKNRIDALVQKLKKVQKKVHHD
jgi:predicted double-glycine peptidase